MNLHLTQYNPDELEAHYFMKKDDKEYCEIRLKSSSYFVYLDISYHSIILEANNMVIVYHGQIFEFYSQMPGTFIANTQTYSSRGTPIFINHFPWQNQIFFIFTDPP